MPSSDQSTQPSNAYWTGKAFHDGSLLTVHRVQTHEGGVHHYALVGENDLVKSSPDATGDGREVLAAFIRYIEQEYGSPVTTAARTQ